MTVTTRHSTRKRQPADQKADLRVLSNVDRSPTVEPLTPCQPENGDAASVVSILRSSILLNELVNASSELVSTRTIHEFLSSRPAEEVLKLRAIFMKLYHCCNDLCATRMATPALPGNPSLFDTTGDDKPEADSKVQPERDSRPSLEGHPKTERDLDNNSSSPNLAYGHYYSVGSNAVPWLRHERETTEECTLKPSRDDVIVDRYAHPVNPKVLDGHSNSAELTKQESVVRELRRAKERPHGMVRDSVSPDTESRFQDEASATRTGSKLRVYPEKQPTVHPRTTPDASVDGYALTPKKDSANDTSNQASWRIVTQTNAEFALESVDQVEKFRLPTNPSQTYKEILASLKCEQQGAARWTDGSEWKSLVETTFQNRQRSAIQYALVAIAFSRWHSSQVQLSSSGARNAAREVSTRLLGIAPKDEHERKTWNRTRKNLATHLTRGRKWSKVVEKLGFGILFKDTWTLAKVDDNSLAELITGIQKSPLKMHILKLLGEQLDILLESGQSRPDTLKQAINAHSLWNLHSSLKAPKAVSEEASALQASMRESTTTSRFQIQDLPFQFEISALNGIGGTSWFSDGLVLLCMHLADKLPYVRVGFSIPIHQNLRGRAGKVLHRPFERAIGQIKEWNNAGVEDRLVCFFPLFQKVQHFSLLEINQRDGCIYHYDAKGYGSTRDIKAACEEQFPGLQYTDQKVPRQLDGFSCGPLVIAMARRRMLGQVVVCGDIDEPAAMQLRVDVLNLITKAWGSGIIVPATAPARKRKSAGDNEALAKRYKQVILVED